MGFINVNGQTIHTSALGTFSITPGLVTTSNNSVHPYLISATGGYLSHHPTTTIYHILGEDIVCDGYKDSITALFISMVNMLGKPYYDEVKKQKINFPPEIEEYLKKKFIILERDMKINSVINDKGNDK